MNQNDKMKVLHAGFRIIRADDSGPKPRIKECRMHTADGKTYVSSIDYYKLGEYDTKAARNRAMEELLKDDKIIED